MFKLLKDDLIKLNQLNYLKQSKRTIFNLTKQWHVTCTFDDNCFNDLMKRFEDHWKPILENEWNKYCDQINGKKPDRYILSMFPYPSGSLHLGHSRLFTTSDTLTRFNQMRKRSVIHPLGWDSFGLPAENAAMQNQLDPNVWTIRNINIMKEQLNSLGLNFNFREATSDPSFYKWTQWLFLKLFENNLAYKTLSYVNWDPIDCTVLANEQIDENGLSWRSGAKVEKRLMKQWFIKTSYLIDKLYRSDETDLDKLGWDQLIRIQRAWFKKPNTYLFYLNLDNDLTSVLPVTANKPEIFFKSNCVIEVSKEHWLASLNNFEIKNPFIHQNQISIKIKDDLKETFFTRLTCPDEEDVEFNEDLRNKIFNICKENTSLGGYFISDNFHDWLVSRQRYWGTPIPIIDCKQCGLQPINENDLPIELPKIDNYVNQFKSDNLTDDKVKKNKKLSHKKKPSRKNSINKLTELAPKNWIYCRCPKCKGKAKRETDTLDTFVDSSWYFLRYASEPKIYEPFNLENCKDPVWLYLGGSEHCKGHMFYSRFIYSFLKEKGLLNSSHAEPFDKILFLGMVNGKTFNYQGKYLKEDDVEKLIEEGKLKKKDIKFKYEKMSKSKMNGVSPENLVKKHGIDITRYCVLGYTSSQKTLNWKSEKDEFNEGMRTLRKFILTVDQFIYLKRLENEKPNAPVVKIYSKHPLNEDLDIVRKKLKDLRNEFAKTVTIYFDYQLKPGKASKTLQEYIKALRRYVLIDQVIKTPEFERALADLVIMFSPLIPHVSEELWSGLTHYNEHLKNDPYYLMDKYCFQQNWPKLDDDYQYTIDIILYSFRKAKYLKSIPIDRCKLIESNRDELYKLAVDEFEKLDIKVDNHIKKFDIYDNLSSRLEIKCKNYIGDDD